MSAHSEIHAARGSLRNPDLVWPSERSPFDALIANLSEQHSAHVDGIKAIEDRLNTFGDELERARHQHSKDTAHGR